MNILAYEFIFSPKNTSNNQWFHYDYNPSIKTVFISMTDLTAKNITQYVKLKPKDSAKKIYY
jgi:hypothetical protein